MCCPCQAPPPSALGLCTWSSLPPDCLSVPRPGRYPFALLWLLTCTLCVLFSPWPFSGITFPLVSTLSSACLLPVWEHREAAAVSCCWVWSAPCSVSVQWHAWHVRASCSLKAGRSAVVARASGVCLCCWHCLAVSSPSAHRALRVGSAHQRWRFVIRMLGRYVWYVGISSHSF